MSFKLKQVFLLASDGKPYYTCDKRHLPIYGVHYAFFPGFGTKSRPLCLWMCHMITAVFGKTIVNYSNPTKQTHIRSKGCMHCCCLQCVSGQVLMSLLSVPFTIGRQGLAADLVLLGTSPRAKASVPWTVAEGRKEGWLSSFAVSLYKIQNCA